MVRHLAGPFLERLGLCPTSHWSGPTGGGRTQAANCCVHESSGAVASVRLLQQPVGGMVELLPSLREAVRAEPNSCSSEVALFWAVPPRFPVQSNFPNHRLRESMWRGLPSPELPPRGPSCARAQRSSQAP